MCNWLNQHSSIRLPARTGTSKAVPLRWAMTHAAGLWIAALVALAPTSARAADGCVVLLCLASPNWKATPQCVPSVHQVFDNLAKGKPFPACSMAGTGNSADHAWASAPAFCPPQYTRVVEGKAGPTYRCDYNGAISVVVGGAPFSRTWWSFIGDSVTEFSPEAKSRLGSWDTRFEDDYAKWLASVPPSAPDAP